jgi:maleylpyruvate isomerase
MAPDEDLAHCRAAHAMLLAAVGDLSDDGARAATGLPGWTVGHVLTHLARNADAFRSVTLEATRGEIGLMYPSAGQRDADIEAGAGRAAEELVTDLRRAVAELERTWEATPEEVWANGRFRGPAGPGTVWLHTTPWRRWREVEVHRADLAPAFDEAALSEPYVDVELPRLLADLPARLDLAGRRHLVAWLLGRADDLGTLALAPWGAPPPPR